MHDHVCIGYQNFGLMLEPFGNANKLLEIVCFGDSSSAGDSVSRRSISCKILCVSDVPVFWQSTAQKSVAPSRSESECASLSKAVKGIMFVIQLLGSMKLSVKLPVMVRVQNEGSVFIASNITTKSCTKLQVHECACRKRIS